jgi:hypothetical protein
MQSVALRARSSSFDYRPEMLRTPRLIIAALFGVAGIVAAAAAIGLAVPADGQQVVPSSGLAEGLHADVTETFTNTHVTYGPEPTVSVTAGQAPSSRTVLNFSLPVGAGDFEAGQMSVSTSQNFSVPHVESSASLSDGFDFLGIRGDGLVTECSAGAPGATGTTELDNVLTGGLPLPQNPAPVWASRSRRRARHPSRRRPLRPSHPPTRHPSRPPRPRPSPHPRRRPHRRGHPS